MNLNYQLILASNSPRRKQLLEALGLEVQIVVQSVDENYPEDLPSIEVPEFLARKKAEAIPVKSEKLVITADTIVISEGFILGKPADKAEAIEMLKRLSGKTHTVITGVCLKTIDKTITLSEITEVTFHHLPEDEIEFYVKTYNPTDKAGAYGIQEWIGMVGIKSIKGDYYNVVGLPIQSLWNALKKFD